MIEDIRRGDRRVVDYRFPGGTIIRIGARTQTEAKDTIRRYESLGLIVVRGPQAYPPEPDALRTEDV